VRIENGSSGNIHSFEIADDYTNKVRRLPNYLGGHIDGEEIMERRLLNQIADAKTVEEILSVMIFMGKNIGNLNVLAALPAVEKAAAERLIFDCNVDLTPFSESNR